MLTSYLHRYNNSSGAIPTPHRCHCKSSCCARAGTDRLAARSSITGTASHLLPASWGSLHGALFPLQCPWVFPFLISWASLLARSLPCGAGRALPSLLAPTLPEVRQYPHHHLAFEPAPFTRCHGRASHPAPHHRQAEGAASLPVTAGGRPVSSINASREGQPLASVAMRHNCGRPLAS